MRHRVLLTLGTLVAVGALTGTVLAGQSTGASAKPTAATSGSFRTPWGHPDLQGIWSNHHQVPLQRPDRFAGKEFLTDEEIATLDREAEANRDRPPAPGQVGVYNSYWTERLSRSKRTSQIVDPPDGKLPPMTAESKARVAEAVKKRVLSPSFEDRDPYERCITRGMPGAMMPGFYNHVYQIFQTPTHVVIHVEMIHDARIIPLDKRPHLPQNLQQWMGDSRGRWEGDTLVVETTNFNGQLPNAYQFSFGLGQGARIVERFRRVDANTIDYRYTVEDPSRFTKSWTAVSPMEKLVEQPLLEYACHEGNLYSTENAVRGGVVDVKTGDAATKEIEAELRRLPAR